MVLQSFKERFVLHTILIKKFNLLQKIFLQFQKQSFDELRKHKRQVIVN